MKIVLAGIFLTGLLVALKANASGAPGLTYLGAFQLPETKGKKTFNYTMGPMAVAEDGKSLFILGNIKQHSVAQVSIPQTLGHDDYPYARLLQPFKYLFSKKLLTNVDNLNRVTGLMHWQNQLLVNGVEYYDADASARQTTMIVRDAADLANSPLDGFYKVAGAARAAGWASPIPEKFSDVLGGHFLFGHSANVPINGRNSLGPSLFVAESLPGRDFPLDQVVKTRSLLNFPLKQRMHMDLPNKSRQNKLWTYNSIAFIGLLTPQMDYLAIGHSGGHESGIGYKLKRSNGRKCFGYCPRDPKDSSAYFWLFDADILIKSAKKEIKPYEARPSAFGALSLPQLQKPLKAAAYHSETQRLYVMESHRLRGKNHSFPLIHVYQLEFAKGVD